MRIVIAGTGNLGASLWNGLEGSRHEVVGLIGDGRQTKETWKQVLYPLCSQFLAGKNSLLGRARRRGLPICWIDKMGPGELAPIAALKPDIILVGGFSVILKKPILQLARVGCVNMHSSLLPRHRGPNPFCAAILSGDSETGVTFHVVDEGIDTGPILDQVAFDIGPADTAYQVYMQSCAIARGRVSTVMDNIEHEGLNGWTQSPELASYDKKPTANDSWINWDLPALEIDRQVRAMAPNPMPRFLHNGHLVTVARTTPDPTPVEAPPGTVLRTYAPAVVATGKGTIMLNVAFSKSPVPWVWPAPWNAPKMNERLPKEFRLE